MGIGFNLFVDQKAYEGWLLMLNGLMWAKEREYEGWRRVWYGASQRDQQRLASVNHLAQQPVPAYRPAPSRARSTSPVSQTFPFTFTLPPLQQPQSNPFVRPSQQQKPPHLQPPPIPTATRPTTTGSKRSAGDALFSPDVRIPPPNKRPVSNIFPTSGMDYTLPPVAESYSSQMMGVESMALGAALGRMSLEPSAPSPPYVTVKKEEDDDEESVLSMTRASSVTQLAAPYRADERLVGRGVPKVCLHLSAIFC